MKYIFHCHSLLARNSWWNHRLTIVFVHFINKFDLKNPAEWCANDLDDMV